MGFGRGSNLCCRGSIRAPGASAGSSGKPGGGRKPISPREIFAAIVYVLRTGCQWKALPKSFGSASAIHQHFQHWRQAGFFVRLWRAGLAEYDEMEGIAWEWQSMDGTQGKAPLAQEAVGNNPTDREKGTQAQPAGGRPWRPALAYRQPEPTARRKLLAQTLDAIVIAAAQADQDQSPESLRGQRLQGQPALNGRCGRETISAHIQRRRRASANATQPGFSARRWVVERTHSWINRFRKLRVQFRENEVANFEALLHLAIRDDLLENVKHIFIYG